MIFSGLFCKTRMKTYYFSLLAFCFKFHSVLFFDNRSSLEATHLKMPRLCLLYYVICKFANIFILNVNEALLIGGSLVLIR